MTQRPPTRRQFEARLQELPAFPPGRPDDRWSDETLQAFVAHSDGEIAALAPAEALAALDALPTLDLEALAAATTRAEVAEIEGRIRERIARRQQPRRRPIVRVKR